MVITGGTGVLGREIGEYLALQGAKVVLMGRNEETGKQIVGGIRGKGGEYADHHDKGIEERGRWKNRRRMKEEDINGCH